ncbi:MAG: PEGA domain-containing protein [Calditrichia bacterium]
MVNEFLREKFPLSYKELQRIKAEEYEYFFTGVENYDLYLNHLGEIQWMKKEEAARQHEFFLHEPTSLSRLKTKLSRRKYPDLSKLPQVEREIRLQIRAYLERQHIGRLSTETEKLIPNEWKYKLSDEEIENIPLILEALESGDWKKPAFAIFFLFFVIVAALAAYFSFQDGEITGSLIVKTNVSGSRIFLDDKTFLGYNGKEIRNIPVGRHKVSVRKSGYVSLPPYQDIEVKSDSLFTLHFELKPLDSRVMGYLRIEAPQPESEVFVDDNYFGKLSEQTVLALETGQHRISVSKAGYVTVPAERLLYISPGDTSILTVDQAPLSASRSQKTPANNRSFSGNLEVTANTSGARIYLNGRDTGKETDYVFSNIKLGRYKVTVVKEGFSNEPEEQTVMLTSSNPSAEVSFHLTQKFEKVTIRADRPDADIFVDGQLKGSGSFEGLLSIGEHTISFGNVPGYNAPKAKKINLKPRLPVSIKVEYFPQMKIVAEVGSDGNIHTTDCFLVTGYTLGNRGFTPSEEAGPEVIFVKNLQDYFWKLGFAFPLRNPKGNDAIKIDFKLPYDLDFEQRFTLRIAGAASRSHYPLAISKKFDVSIKFNNTILSYYYQPKIFEDLNGVEVQEWDITRDVKPGTNTLELSTTSSNNTYYILKRIEIFN